MESAPINVWTEMRATPEGISITLYSEWRGNNGDPTKVEDEAWYTHTELEVLSQEGGIRSDLKLSDSTQESLSNLRQNADISEIWEEIDEAEDELPEEGAILIDENSPEWSEFDSVKVVEVLEDVTCEEYVIDGPNAGLIMKDKSNQSLADKTVSDTNPSYDEDEPVVLAKYSKTNGTWSDEYAFPASRLVE